jgi:hypothetical protein
MIVRNGCKPPADAPITMSSVAGASVTCESIKGSSAWTVR